MGYAHLEQAKQKRFFYRDKFRATLAWLLVSLTMTMVLIVAIVFWRLTQKGADFYATNGVAAPISLTPLDAPNQSSESLLPPDPPEEMGLKGLKLSAMTTKEVDYGTRTG
jgi:intracellular multiplication protein IcmM